LVKKLQIEIHAYMRVKSVTVRLIDGWLRKKKRFYDPKLKLKLEACVSHSTFCQ